MLATHTGFPVDYPRARQHSHVELAVSTLTIRLLLLKMQNSVLMAAAHGRLIAKFEHLIFEQKYACLMKRRRFAFWSIAAAIVVAASAVVLLLRHWRPGSTTIQGAVIRQEADTRQELPIAGVVVTAWDGVSISTTQSDASGYFKLNIHKQSGLAKLEY